MDLITLAEAMALAQVIGIDLLLAGDNAIVVGLVAAGLAPEHRGRVIAMGIAVAVIARIAFAVTTVQLLQITGLLLAGGLLLLWVCWRLWRELREHSAAGAASRANAEQGGEPTGPKASDPSERPNKTLLQATVQIVVADLSMSLDNVLAVAGVARDHVWVLVFGLVFSVILMGVAASYIARLLARHIWIGYLGLALIAYVSVTMIHEGLLELLPVFVG